MESHQQTLALFFKSLTQKNSEFDPEWGLDTGT